MILYEHKDNQLSIELLNVIVEVLVSCQSILKSCEQKIHIFPITNDNKNCLNPLTTEEVKLCNRLLRKIGCTQHFYVPELVCSIQPDARSIETAISKLIGFTSNDWRRLVSVEGIENFERKLNYISFRNKMIPQSISSDKLPSFDIYSQGSISQEAIILIPPCGVPAALFKNWLEVLGDQYYTITFEDPFIFSGADTSQEPTGNISQEVECIRAILKDKNISRAHLVGICGGAPIALAAAAEFASDIASLLIFHGDFYFGPHTPRSAFQKQFQGLLSDSARNVSRANEVYEIFLDPSILFNIPSQLGPFILYPYSNFKIFQRYSKINSGLMSFDATCTAKKIKQPVKIITSTEDRMTPSETSKMLHHMIKSSTLLERKFGSHHDALLGDEEILKMISTFVNKVNSNEVVH